MYPSDLSDQEWKLIAHFFERPYPHGNKGEYSKRDIVKAILYVVKGGITWRMMPKDSLPGIPSTTISADGTDEACGNRL